METETKGRLFKSSTGREKMLSVSSVQSVSIGDIAEELSSVPFSLYSRGNSIQRVRRNQKIRSNGQGGLRPSRAI